jgi:hypothetical protein
MADNITATAGGITGWGGTNCRLPIANCRLKKREGQGFGFQLAIGNRQFSPGFPFSFNSPGQRSDNSKE